MCATHNVRMSGFTKDWGNLDNMHLQVEAVGWHACVYRCPSGGLLYMASSNHILAMLQLRPFAYDG